MTVRETQEGLALDSQEFDAKQDMPQPALSTDYVNQFAEIAMLLELAAMDETILPELSTWSPRSYFEHFENSGLRGAAMALEGYTRLPAHLKRDFDEFSELLVRLGETSIAAMQRATTDLRRREIFQAVGPVFQTQIARMTRFMNANGREPVLGSDASIQAMIDGLIEE